MMIALHIVVYILTLAFIWVLTIHVLREERSKVTVGDILADIPWIMHIPVINTMLLIIIGVAFLIWEVFGVGTLCRKIWDKVKDIEV